MTSSTELTAPVTVTPMMLIDRAAAQGASIEQMAQLFDLKLRVEADEARKAFNEAMAKFKAEPPRINKNKHVKAGPMEYDHATLDHVVDMIAPALSAVGIRHRWEPDQSHAPQISVTCILSLGGHDERTKLTALADTSGSKNGIQAIGSAVTYLQRYTLLAACGLAAGGTDDDAAATEAVKGRQMPIPDLIEWVESIESAQTLADLQTTYTAAYKEAQGLGDKVAMAKVIAAKNQRKAAL